MNTSSEASKRELFAAGDDGEATAARQRLSALLDGELEAHQLDAALRDARCEQLRADWRTWSLIGDALRSEAIVARDMTAAVMTRLDEEPVVLAPRNVHVAASQHPLLALAASLTGVAVVAWLALAQQSQPAPVQVAAAAPPAATSQARDGQPPPLHGDLNEYLLAHQTQAASFRLADGAQQIRSVSLVGGAPRR